MRENPRRTAITAKVAGSHHFNVLATSDTLFSREATTGFPYNCASRRTVPPVAGGTDALEMPCSLSDVAVRSKRPRPALSMASSERQHFEVATLSSS